MTPADQLRRAAETLRARAEGATPGPWVASHDAPSPHRPPDTYSVEGDDGYGPDFTGTFHDVAFVALMDPTMAGLVADVLDEVWAWREEGLGVVSPQTNWPDMLDGVLARALALAEHISGRTA